jgi:hypothetical protein
MKNVFNVNDVNAIINRINTLTPITTATWGKMDVAQMLAHCNVTYEMVYDNKHPKPNAFVKFMLKTFVKKIVVNTTPYKKNSRTAPQFLITSNKQFDVEKLRLINHIQQTQQLGEAHFEGKTSHSFGNLTATEWNNMFYKHLDHHLSQFGA